MNAEDRQRASTFSGNCYFKFFITVNAYSDMWLYTFNIVAMCFSDLHSTSIQLTNYMVYGTRRLNLQWFCSDFCYELTPSSLLRNTDHIRSCCHLPASFRSLHRYRFLGSSKPQICWFFFCYVPLGASGLWLGTRTGAGNTATLTNSFFFLFFPRSPWLLGQQV